MPDFIPDLMPERPDLMPERPDVMPERPDVMPERPDVMPDLMPERPDLMPETPDWSDLRPDGGCEKQTKKLIFTTTIPFFYLSPEKNVLTKIFKNKMLSN